MNLEKCQNKLVRNPVLLFRPKSREDQCSQDYLLRAVEANRLPNINKLAKIIGLQTEQMVHIQPPEFERIISADIQNLALLISMARNTGSMNLVSKSFGMRAKICPICCLNGEPVPASANFPLALDCLKHKVLYIDECPSCGRELTYQRRRYHYCGCGYDLRCSPQVSSPAWVYLFYEIFAPWRIQPKKNLSEKEILKNEHNSISIISALLARKASFRLGRMHYLLSTDLAKLEPLISGWPEEFENRLSEMLVDLTKPGRHQFLSKFRNRATPAIRVQFEHFHEKFVVRMRKIGRTKNGSQIYKQENYISANKVRNIFKYSTAVMKKFLASSYVKEVVVVQRAKKRFYFLDKYSVDKLVTKLEHTLSLESASNLLGCKIYFLRALANGKLIPATCLPFQPRRPRFYQTDINTYWSRLNKKVLPKSGKVKLIRLVTISAVTCHSEVKICWLRMMKAISAGDIPVYLNNISDTGLNSLYVSVADALRYRAIRDVGQ